MDDGLAVGYVSWFEHHAVITLPGGIVFQVPRSAVEECQGGSFILREDAVIEHMFIKPVPRPKLQVLVPKEVIARLPA